MFYTKNEKIYPASVSKHSSSQVKQVILLMISNGEKRVAKSEGRRWHYLAVKKQSALLTGITSKHYSDLHCLNCLHCFRTKTNLNCTKEYVKIKIFVM